MTRASFKFSICFVLCYRYENEQPFRKAVEEEISSLYKVIDDANLTRVDLELQIESMKAELSDLARNHEEVCYFLLTLDRAGLRWPGATRLQVAVVPLWTTNNKFHNKS